MDLPINFNSFKLDSIMGHIMVLVMAYNIWTSQRLKLVEQLQLLVHQQLQLVQRLHQHLQQHH